MNDVMRDYSIVSENDTVSSSPTTSTRNNNISEMPDAIPEGKRNDVLFQMVCSLQKQKFSDQSIRAMIEFENNQKCVPPLTEQELDELLLSALSFDEESENEYSSNVEEVSIQELEAIETDIQDDYPVYIVTNQEDKKALSKIGIKAYKIDSWKKEYWSYFKGCRMVAFLRNDDSNSSILYKISNALSRIAFSRRIIETSKQAGGGVADYLQLEGHRKEDLIELISNADCQYANWVSVEGKNKLKINGGLLAKEIANNNNIFVARHEGLDNDKLFWYSQGVYKAKSKTEVMAEVMKYIPSAYQSTPTLRNIATLVGSKSDTVDYDDLDKNERYVNVQNGLLDIETFELVPHDPERCGTIQLKCEWEPGAKMDRWIAFVSDLCRDVEGEVDVQMLLVLQEWIGLFLSSLHGYRIKKSLVLFSSQGNTGKSVLEKVFNAILGSDNTANVSFQEMGTSRWATGRAFGKRLIVVGDQSAERIENSSTFKQLTGGDKVAAEFKGVQAFNYVFKGMIVIACNKLPVFEDDKGEHMAERLMFLPCRNVIPEEERNLFLLDDLIKERNGIFLWAMNGLKRIRHNNFKFTQCDCAQELMDRFRSRNDTMYAFLREECIFTGCDADTIRKTIFEEKYRDFCVRKEVTALASKNISDRAEALGHTLRVKDGYKVYRGLRLRRDDIEAVMQSAENYLKDGTKYSEDSVQSLQEALNSLKKTFEVPSSEDSSKIDLSSEDIPKIDLSNTKQIDQATDALRNAIKNLAGLYYDGFVPLDDDELAEFDDSKSKWQK